MTWNAFSMSLFANILRFFAFFIFFFFFPFFVHQSLAITHTTNLSASLFHTLNHFNDFCMSLFCDNFFFFALDTQFFNRLITVFFTTHRFHVIWRSMPIDPLRMNNSNNWEWVDVETQSWTAIINSLSITWRLRYRLNEQKSSDSMRFFLSLSLCVCMNYEHLLKRCLFIHTDFVSQRSISLCNHAWLWCV